MRRLPLHCLPSQYRYIHLLPTADRCFEVRLGVSLWDAAAGCFFGPTAHSAPVPYDMRRSKG